LSPGQTPIPTAKPSLHPKKVMLCVWWDMFGVIYFELLNPNQTINSEVYCRQLDQLNQSLKSKRPALVNRKGVILHHDNVRPHVSKMTQQKIRELGWELLPHPTYSPDIAASDYHLFRSIQNYLNRKKFNNTDEVNSAISEFFASKPPQFYRNGIEKLPKRWSNVIDNDGDYIID
jgi:histone-lysine N-methyltransferase SETMAR